MSEKYYQILLKQVKTKKNGGFSPPPFTLYFRIILKN